MATQNTQASIDLIQTAKNIWQKKGFILIIIIISTMCGLTIKSLKSKKKIYTTSCTLLFFQSQDLISSNKNSQEPIIPFIAQHVPAQSYSSIINSTPFLQKILTLNIQINNNLIPVYTCINPQISDIQNLTLKDSILQLNTIQEECINSLRKAISTETNEKNRTFTINITLKDPNIAAQIAQQTKNLFIKQIQSIEEQVQKEFIKYEQQNNKSINNENNLSQMHENLYKELKTQTIFYTLEPVILPTIPETPPSKSISFFVCLGLLLGIGLVLILPLIAEITESKYLSSWNSKKL